jgi:hypothetical protein
MEYSLQIQEIGKGTLGHIKTETIAEVGDWIIPPDAPGKRYEVKKRLFRYDTTAKGTKDKTKEWPLVTLYVKEVVEEYKWETT